MLFRSFLLPWLAASATRLGEPAGYVAPIEDNDDSASRALEAAIMGLPSDIASNSTQQQQLAAVEDAILKEAPKLRKQSKKVQRTKQEEVVSAKVLEKKQYPSYGIAPVTVAPATVAPVAPVTTSTPPPHNAAAPVVTAAPPMVVADLDSWRMQMESKLHTGLSSEIKILNTLMAHQTQTHKQLLRFKQVLTVLGSKYQAQEQVTQQQQAKITSLESQLASVTQQVASLHAKFNAYKQQYEAKWTGSQTAIDNLYKKTADALGAMSTVHAGVQKELNAMANPATVAPGAEVAPSLPAASTQPPMPRAPSPAGASPP